MRVSAKQLAEQTGWTYTQSAAVLQVAEVQGVAVVAGEERGPSGKGRPTKFYEVPEVFQINLNKPVVTKVLDVDSVADLFKEETSEAA